MATDAKMVDECCNSYALGQSWAYEAPRGFEKSRIVIGAILTFASFEPIICASVIGAPMLDDDGREREMLIPFLPFSRPAFARTVTSHKGKADIPAEFKTSYESWKNDEKGLCYLNVPFKGLLRQMADGLEEKQKAAGIACINSR
jgi:hypothetical protein